MTTTFETLFGLVISTTSEGCSSTYTTRRTHLFHTARTCPPRRWVWSNGARKSPSWRHLIRTTPLYLFCITTPPFPVAPCSSSSTATTTSHSHLFTQLHRYTGWVGGEARGGETWVGTRREGSCSRRRMKDVLEGDSTTSCLCYFSAPTCMCADRLLFLCRRRTTAGRVGGRQGRHQSRGRENHTRP